MNAILASCLIVLLHCAVESSSMSTDLLLREFKEIRELERQSQKEKRVTMVLELMISPLESHDLFYERKERQMCDAGEGKQVTATCNGDVTCNEEGTEECKPVCDAPVHGDIVFECKCKSNFTSPLCDTTIDDREDNCNKCKDVQIGNHCIRGTYYQHGFACYDEDWNETSYEKKSLEQNSGSSEEDDEGDEDLVLVARIIQAYVNEKL